MAWKQVWSNSVWALDVEWSYKQDPIDNTTTYTVTQLRARSLSSAASFSRSQGIDAGIATITAQRVVKKNLAGSCSAKGSKVWNLANDSRTFKHGSDGSTPAEINVHGYLDINLSSSYLPAGGWKVANVAGSIPDIDRKAPNTNNVSLVSSTYNSLTIKLDCSAQCNYAAYKLDGGSWQYFTPPTAIVENTGTANYTITGLSPNKTYKVEVAYRRTYNHVWGYSSAVNMTTAKPPAPTSGKITASNITHKSIDFTISGVTPTSPASIARYEYWGNGQWNSNGSSPTYRKTGLQPNTEYLAEMRGVDNYGTPSTYVSLRATTAKPPIPSIGTVSIINTTENGVTAQISGFAMGDMAILANYRYKVLDSAGTEVIPLKLNGTSTTINITGLQPETTYTLYVDAVDNYSQSNSGWATVSFTTLADKFIYLIEPDGAVTQHDMYLVEEVDDIDNGSEYNPDVAHWGFWDFTEQENAVNMTCPSSSSGYEYVDERDTFVEYSPLSWYENEIQLILIGAYHDMFDGYPVAIKGEFKGLDDLTFIYRYSDGEQDVSPIGTTETWEYIEFKSNPNKNLDGIYMTCRTGHSPFIAFNLDTVNISVCLGTTTKVTKVTKDMLLATHSG